ncbi:uncharacterized protein [Nicotiana tomentosiformis]|uniref:Uncharacterized protein n=1 Tax=Nicotiana tabacum TaxID=4097 RepID=A0A1S4B6E9_TOBAC|nr:uncharacterized protein LOC104108893 [Nicotiana tomentosiformis]XP_016484422.1 PREDICTED: uncharacterized protein LOC107804964 [Nicotiana tabacum]
MEGVGARLGRSSTRYGGPTTVFTGPVRRWKKKWIHVTPPTSGNNHQRANGRVKGSNGSHLLLFKWTHITASQNNNGTADGNGEKNHSPNDGAVAVEELPKRKFKYIPVALLEEQKYEESEHTDNEAKPNETESNGEGPTSEPDGFDEKPDINDVPMEESQAPQDNPTERQYLNESNLDLSLG